MELVSDRDHPRADIKLVAARTQAMDNLTSGYYPINPLRIEERPLLDFQEAVQLASLAASIFVVGTLVQVPSSIPFQGTETKKRVE